VKIQFEAQKLFEEIYERDVLSFQTLVFIDYYFVANTVSFIVHTEWTLMFVDI